MRFRQNCGTYCIGLLVGVFLWSACSDNESARPDQDGTYTKPSIYGMSGFGEQRSSILVKEGVTLTQFKDWSTDSAWSLAAPDRSKLKAIREASALPTRATLLQKVISLSAIADYANNTYGGTLGGYVAVAADVKWLSTMSEIYYGLRLDYTGTSYSPAGTGYAVVRFFSDHCDRLAVPYCTEMGGTNPHAWPNGGGGFTTSSLGDGGYPEMVFDGYYLPVEGAEIYEVSADGYEILRLVFQEGRWVRHAVGIEPLQQQTKQAETLYEGVFVEYQGHRFAVRGVVDGICYLTTFEYDPQLSLILVEKGVWELRVPVEELGL